MYSSPSFISFFGGEGRSVGGVVGGGVLEFYRGRGSIHFAFLFRPPTKYKHLSLRSDSDRSEFELILCMFAS